MNKTQMVKALRAIIESPDDVQEWERQNGQFEGDVFSVAVVNVERLKALLPQPKAAVPDGDRDGVTYDPELDYERLNRQMKAVWFCLRGGDWKTLHEISRFTGMPEASISARIRDLRKPKFGEQEVQTRRASNGLWQYRVARTGEQ